MATSPRAYSKRRFFVIAATALLGTLFTARIKKAKLIRASPSVSEQKRRTVPTDQDYEEPEPDGCRQNRIDSLNGPGPGKEWHIGGWAVRRMCSQPLDTLFFVHTAPTHWERRIHHRATVFEDAARAAFNWTGVFFVGEHRNPLVNLWTKLEAEATGDVVIFPYNDTYSTIIYKFVFGMRWVTEYCPNVRNIVKMDDDVGVQPFELRRYLDEKLPLKNTSIHGYVWSESDVYRDPGSIYCIPEDQLALDTLPLYCSGRSMIMTMQTMGKLYSASKVVKGYAIDDAYVSGHLALFANVGHENITSKLNWYNVDKTEDLLRGTAIFTHDNYRYENTVGRRAQWGLMIWKHMLQAPRRHAFNHSNRLADTMYRDDFRATRRALKEGQYLALSGYDY